MQRREFIRRLIGVDFKTLLTMAGILLVIFVLFSTDFTNAPGSIIGIVKVGGFLLMFFLLFLIAAIFISILIRQFLKLLPGRITLWLKKYGEKILLTIVTLLSAYFIYDSIKKEKYFILFFMLVYFGFSYLFRDNEKTDKRNNPI